MNIAALCNGTRLLIDFVGDPDKNNARQVNARPDLKTFAVSLDVSRDLIKHVPDGVISITESGLQTERDLRELKAIGYSGFLIGETLMRTGDPAAELRRLRDTR